MEVMIANEGFIKTDANPAHEVAYVKPWKLLQWYRNDIELWMSVLHAQSTYDCNGVVIEPMDLLCTTPVCTLRYGSHKTGYGRVEFDLKSPDQMLKSWDMESTDKESENNLKVKVTKTVNTQVVPADESGGKNNNKSKKSRSKK